MAGKIAFGLTLIATVGMISTQAQADEEDRFGRPGPYLGGGLSLGFENFDVPDSLDYETAKGFDVWFGYRLVPNVAVEAELQYVNGFDLEGASSGLDALTWNGNLKGYLLTGRFQPFAAVGLGMTTLRAPNWRESEFSARFAGGLDLYLVKFLALQAKASYVLLTDDLDGADYADLTLGAQLRF